MLDVLIATTIIWLAAAIFTAPVLSLLELGLVLVRGSEYRAEWTQTIRSWIEERGDEGDEGSGPRWGQTWRILYQWPLLWLGWFLAVSKGQGMVEHLSHQQAERDEAEAGRERTLNSTIHRLRERIGCSTWTFQINIEQDRTLYLLLVTAGPLVLSHCIIDDHQGNYEVGRVGALYPLEEGVLNTQTVDIEPLSLMEAIEWCEGDLEWIALCADLKASEGRYQFLVGNNPDE